MLRLNCLFPLGLSVAACLSAQTTPAIDNDQVRVLSVTDKPHEKGAPHEHTVNRVMVYLDSGEQQFTTPDGKKTTLKVKAGDVKWSPATGTHTSEVLSATPLRIIEVELKKAGDKSKSPNAALDPVKVAPKIYHVEFENDQVRVVRGKFGPNAAIPEHEHMLNRVVVYLTPLHNRITATDGKAEDSERTAGSVSFGSPARHKEQNMLSTPAEIIMVELKN